MLRAEHATVNVQSATALEIRMAEFFTGHPDLRIGSKNFNEQTLQRLKALGSCGRILENIFENLEKRNLSTKVVSGGSYISLFWNDRERDTMVSVSLMVGFDSQWKPISVSSGIEKKAAGPWPAAEDLPPARDNFGQESKERN
jgi:hypothetical protein